MQSAAQAYKNVARQTSSPRELEASLLLQAASRLQTLHRFGLPTLPSCGGREGSFCSRRTTTRTPSTRTPRSWSRRLRSASIRRARLSTTSDWVCSARAP